MKPESREGAHLNLNAFSFTNLWILAMTQAGMSLDSLKNPEQKQCHCFSRGLLRNWTKTKNPPRAHRAASVCSSSGQQELCPCGGRGCGARPSGTRAAFAHVLTPLCARCHSQCGCGCVTATPTGSRGRRLWPGRAPSSSEDSGARARARTARLAALGRGTEEH